jgi:hypothetical protein
MSGAAKTHRPDTSWTVPILARLGGGSRFGIPNGRLSRSRSCNCVERGCCPRSGWTELNGWIYRPGWADPLYGCGLGALCRERGANDDGSESEDLA